ncbi:MAG: cytochrome c [Chloroflexi bacterium]|nr:cytochrome c [Chloroflexota bacterium]
MMGKRYGMLLVSCGGILLFLLMGLRLINSGTQVLAVPLSQDPKEGQAIFQEKCAACHTIGQGDRVGPDLKGVTASRDRAWLTRWLLAPDRMISQGDPIATGLLKKYNNMPMPNLGLTEQQVEAVIAYLKTAETAPVAIPAQYIPTLAIGVLAIVGLTLLGIIAGTKRVEVRP